MQRQKLPIMAIANILLISIASVFLFHLLTLFLPNNREIVVILWTGVVILVLWEIFKEGFKYLSKRHFSEMKIEADEKFGNPILTIVTIPTIVVLFLLSGIGDSVCFNVAVTPAILSKREIKILLVNFDTLNTSPLTPDKVWRNELEKIAPTNSEDINISYDLVNIPEPGNFNITQAKTLSNCFYATMVIWGVVGNGEVQSYFTLTPRYGTLFGYENLQFNAKADDLNRVVSTSPIAFELPYLIAQHLQLWGKSEIAKDYMMQALSYQISGGDANAVKRSLLELTGTIYADIGEHEIALLATTAAMAIEGSTFSDQINYAVVMYKTGQIENATTLLLDVIANAPPDDPNLAIAYFDLGTLYLTEGNIDESINSLTKAVKKNDSFVQAYSNRANAYLLSGQYVSAIADANFVLGINSLDVSMLNTRADAELQLEQYVVALNDYHAMLSVEPNNIYALLGLAVISNVKENDLEAVKYAQQVLLIDPNNKTAKISLGISLFNLNRYTEAIYYLDQALQMEQSTIGYWVRARSKYLLKDFRGAVEDFLIAESLGYENLYDLYSYIASCYFILGDITNEKKYVDLWGKQLGDVTMENVHVIVGEGNITFTPEATVEN